MENEKMYLVEVYTENQVGLLVAVSGIFTRRSLNIDRLETAPSPLEGIHVFYITTVTTLSMIRKVVQFLEKKVDVVKAFYKEYEGEQLLTRPQFNQTQLAMVAELLNIE